MVLTGVLRHYASVLMATTPKKADIKAIREQRALAHGAALRTNYHVLSRKSFEARRDFLIGAFESGAYLKAPNQKGQPPANPMTDPNAMEGMMGMMKNNMAMIIPNTLIMSWINAFFSGYVISMAYRLFHSLLVLTTSSETAISHYNQVQEHAAGRCTDQRHGPAVDVQHQLVLFVHFWSAVCLCVPPR